MKKVAIIGSGIAGLSAGILAQNNGFETEIYEMHYLPGGLCTSWQRKGYVFDGCIRYLYGSGEGRMCNSLMKKIGVIDGQQFIHYEESNRVETNAGKTVIFHCDLDKLKMHLLEISPEDEKQILALIRAAKSISCTSMPMVGPTNLSEYGLMAKAIFRILPVIIKYRKESLASFAASFKSEALKEAFNKYYGFADLGELPLFVLILDLAQHHMKNAGWPIGGSLALARKLEKKYLSLGGKINYRTKVEKILVDGEMVKGIRLADGRECLADIVISACDVETVLNKLLEGKFNEPKYYTAFEKEKIITPIVQISLGIADDLSGIPHSLTFSLKEPITIEDITYDYLNIRHYCYDQTMAPKGSSSLIVILETNYEKWARLSLDKERYSIAKQNAAEQVIDRLDQRFPGLAGKVEVIDAATPLTYVQYTGNYKGSPQGWQTTAGHLSNFPSKLAGLKNFYLAGQWVRRGGGIPGGAASAYNVVKQICKEAVRKHTMENT